MADIDPFALNIKGVENLVESGINKTTDLEKSSEGVEGEPVDTLELNKTDEELLKLRDEFQSKHDGYFPKIKPRQEKNKLYYAGKQRQTESTGDGVISSNLIFEAEETFIPQALSNNPEPVVYSDNTPEGKAASNDLKTMLQYHADILCLRKKLGVMVRQWSIYFIGVVKHGWDAKASDIKCELRRPQNFLLDPDGYIDEYGNFVGLFLGERIESTAQSLIDEFPKHKDYITLKVGEKLGTTVVRTEWWTDDYSFTTFEDVVLDKYKNPFFNYQEESESSTPAINHFGVPKMPYTFLSVFSLQERPHDITNLIEQNIPNQDRINDRDDQITRNLRSGNNSLVLSKLHGWNSQNAGEASHAIEDGDPILGDAEIDDRSIRRLPASPLPSGVIESQQNDKETLRSIFGTQGLSAQPDQPNTTARGQILNQSHDSTRIGGGIGDALEQVADNIFNWWTQLYCVFYDEKHYAAVMGDGHAVEYVSLTNTDMIRKFVVSVSPNSMQPKDEVSEMNQAIELWNNKALDPISLFTKLNDPDPVNTAKRVALWVVNPQAYMMQYFPEQAPPPQGAPPGGAIPQQPGSPPSSLGQTPASAQLNQVPLPK